MRRTKTFIVSLLLSLGIIVFSLFLFACATLVDHTEHIVISPVTIFSISLSRPYISIQQGRSDTLIVRVNRSGGHSDSVNLTLEGTIIGAGVYASFDPNPVAVSDISSQLTLTVDHSVAPGVYELTVKGNDSTGQQTSPLQLTVTATNSGYSISLSRSNLSIPQGGADTLTVFVERSGGHNSAIAFSLYGEPNDVTYTFDPSTVTAGGNSSLLSLRVDQNASITGGTPVRVVGNDGTSEQGAYFTLAITAYVNPWQGGFSQFPTLSGVHFTDVDHGVAVGWSGTVIRTENGGSVWNQLDAGTSEYLNAVQFTDATTGFIVGDHNTFLFTFNGGASWVDTLGIDNVNTDFNGMYFLSAQKGWVVGNVIGYTINGGGNWDIQLESQAGRIFNEIEFGSPSNGVAVGRKSASEGVIFYTHDAGDHWYESTYPGATIPWINDVCFVNSSTAYAVGTHGTIVKSTNGGESWSQLVSNTNDNLFGVSFGDENNGWAVSSHIIHTNDAGQTWSEEITLTRTANDVYFLNSRTGYAVGESGIIFRRF